MSALLANLYLHWFDALFHGANGPARTGKAKLVRYADDMVAGEWPFAPVAAHRHDGRTSCRNWNTSFGHGGSLVPD